MTARSAHNGFSFIELSIALALVGLFTATCLQIYKANQQLNFTTALAYIKDAGPVDTAMGRFALQNGRYPCPADPALPEENPNAGVEYCQYNAMAAINAAIVPGPAGAPATCNAGGGFCRSLGTNGATDDGNSILYGSIPYTTLGLPAQYDGWNKKFGYAVTEALTVSPLPATTTINGSLTLMADNKSRDGQYAPNNFPFVVWSYGSGMKGAWSPGGQQLLPCDTTTKDGTNCANTGHFLYSSEAGPSFGTGNTSAPIRSLAPGPNFYDSYIELYQLSQCRDWWCMSPATSSSASSMSAGMIKDTTAFVGIGTPSPQYQLDVAGDIQVPKVVAPSLCRPGDTHNLPTCFNPDLIGGIITVQANPDGTITNTGNPNAGIGYGTSRGCWGETIAGVQNSTAVCPQKIVNSPIANISCGTTGGGDPRYIIGFDSGGNLLCYPP